VFLVVVVTIVETVGIEVIGVIALKREEVSLVREV
jgi:hypothetical protein